MREILDQIRARHEVRTVEASAGGMKFTLLVVRDSNVLLERLTPEAFAVDERLPYWADLWSSSRELARWCLEDLDLRGLQVLELGCGVGLAGIAASASGARVTMTDYEEDALLFARYNLLANIGGGEPPVKLFHLDWRDPVGLERYDLVLGADIVYDRANHQDLLLLCERVLLPGGRVLLTEPGRSTAEGFVAMACQRGFSVTVQERQSAGGPRTLTHRRIELRKVCRD